MYYPVKTIDKNGKVVERFRRMHSDNPQPKDALQRMLDSVMVEDEVIALSEATNAYLLNDCSFTKIRRQLDFMGLVTKENLTFEDACEQIKDYGMTEGYLTFYTMAVDDDDDCVLVYLTVNKPSAVRKFYLDLAIQGA